MKSIEISIVAYLCLAVVCYLGSSNSNKELQKLQIEKTKLSIEILKLKTEGRALTVGDLKAIYECVDTKIKNNGKSIKFPCVAAVGDSY